jgi:hypothetical protein
MEHARQKILMQMRQHARADGLEKDVGGAGRGLYGKVETGGIRYREISYYWYSVE